MLAKDFLRVCAVLVSMVLSDEGDAAWTARAS